MKRFLFVLALAIATRASAQVVEVPEAFDSAGHVTVITPATAARLQLSPPAWRITGDYAAARLYALGAQGWVIVVERRDGAVERYAITAADREYLRARTSTLPAGFEEQVGRIGAGLSNVGQQITTAARSDAFVMHQGVLAALVYGPAFAYALSNETPGRVAAYVLGAGGTFYAATQLARSRNITPEQTVFSTMTAIHGAGVGLGLAYAAHGNSNVQGAAAFLGGVGGTMAALAVSPSLSEGDVAGAQFGGDALALTAYLITRAGHERAQDYPTRTEAGILAASVIAGYPLGLEWARSASYNLTPGDVGAMWVTGAVGGLAAGTIAHAVVRNQSQPTGTSAYRDRHQTAVYSSAAGGFIVGAVAGEFLLARRFDHTPYEAGMLGLGAAGGALVGAGAYTLFHGASAKGATVPYVAATIGAVSGLALAEALMPPRDDAGRQTSMRVHVDPMGFMLAAARAPGAHSLVQVSF
jgi:hypothetical protein